ncbi:MAG: O-antigen ligase family protein [Parcubacteria group bacterium]
MDNANKPAGRIIRTTLLFVLFFELLSYISYALNIFGDYSSLIFVLIVLATFVLGIYKIEWGIYVALAELFIGSQGYLFRLATDNGQVSIRIGIFCAVTVAWVIWLIKQRTTTPLISFVRNNKPVIALGIIWIFGLVMAFVQRNSATFIYRDANSWLYFLYALPFLTVIIYETQINAIKQIFIACVSYICVKSLVFVYLFSHNIPWLAEIYKWGRDTGWGEFTPISGNFFRIFSQAQIFALLAAVLFIGPMIFNYKQQSHRPLASPKHSDGGNYGTASVVFLCLTIATVFLSLSRTFWLALGASVLIMLVYGLITRQIAIKRLLAIIGQLIILSAVGYGIIFGAVNLPWPSTIASMDLSTRLQYDSAASTRTNELLPLLKAIAKHPVVGSGWGRAVTFTSLDPRFLANNPDGQRTTYAFEWGYLDIILKIGLLGFFIYLYLIWTIGKKLYLARKKNADWALPLLFCLIALLIVHTLTPYLNVPLGIGVILLLLVFVNQESYRQNSDGRLQNH